MGQADAFFVLESRCYNPRSMKHDRAVRWLAVVLVVCAFIGFVLLSFPASKEDTTKLLDFSEFYVAGQIVRQGLGNRLYDFKLQAELQLQVAPVHAFYLRPPFEAILFVPLTYLNYRAAYTTWVMLSLGLLVGASYLIESHSRVSQAITQYARGIPADFGLVLVIFLTFLPTMECFLIGQDSMLMLVVYTLVFVSLKSKRDFVAGCVLACGLFKFHLVIPFAVVFLLRRQWTFLRGFAAVGIVLMVLSIAVSGPNMVTAYPRMFFDSAYRQLMGFQPEYAANLRGLVYLLVGRRIPAVVSGIVVAIFSGLLLWTTARNWNDERFGFCFAAALVAALLTGYHLFVYDLTLLLLPIAIVCGELARGTRLLSNTILNLVLVLFFVPTIHRELILHHIYALMCIPLIVLYVVVMRIVANSGGLGPALNRVLD
jgi:hypothetical protein